MKDTTILTLSKIFAVLFVVFGVITSLAALALLAGAGAGTTAEIMADKAGSSVGTLPYTLMLLTALLSGVLAVVYFVTAFSLFKQKKWAYLSVGAVGVVGLLSTGLTLSLNRGYRLSEVSWSIFYLGFAYFLSTKKGLFNK